MTANTPLDTNDSRASASASARERARPRQIQLPTSPPHPSLASTRLHGPATAPILPSRPQPHGRHLLVPSPSPRQRLEDQQLSQSTRIPARSSPLATHCSSAYPNGERQGEADVEVEVEVDYFSLPQVSPTLSTGLQLGLGRSNASHAPMTDLRFPRPVPLKSEQLGQLAERASGRNVSTMMLLPHHFLAAPRSTSRGTWWPTDDMQHRPRPASTLLSPRIGPSIPEFGTEDRGIPDRTDISRSTSCSSNPSQAQRPSPDLQRPKSLRSIHTRRDPARSPSSLAASFGSRARMDDFHDSHLSPGGTRDEAQTPGGEAADTLAAPHAVYHDAPGLHGVGGGTQYGASVRRKVVQLLEPLIKLGPLPPRYAGRIVQIAE